MPLTHSLPRSFPPRKTQPSRRPASGRYFGPSPLLLRGRGEDVELPKLIGCFWGHSGGRRGSPRRGPPLSDGDWIRLNRPGWDWCKGPQSSGILGRGVGGSGNPAAVAARGFSPSACPLRSIGSRGRARGPATSSRGGGGGSCRVLGAGPVGRAAGGGW